MRLLIVTQKVDKNDPILGFFHRWIVEFAKNVQSVVVITLSEGVHELPTNVTVHSLGKEKGASKFTYILKFLTLIVTKKNEYDTVFVHMNPIYVALGGVFWKMLGKKVALWYTHKNVDLKLRVAVYFANIIFTASKSSFNLPSPKVQVTGHGIDIASFAVRRMKNLGTEPVRIMSVGRITQIKNPLVLVEAASILKEKWKKAFEVVFIGSPVTEEDWKYAESVDAIIRTKELSSYVKFLGSLPPEAMPTELALTDLSLNLTPTGGVDKVVLESMAAGVPVMSSNEAFKDYFGMYSDDLIFKVGDAEDLANKIMSLFEKHNLTRLGLDLQRVVKEKSDVGNLIKNLCERMSKI